MRDKLSVETNKGGEVREVKVTHVEGDNFHLSHIHPLPIHMCMGRE